MYRTGWITYQIAKRLVHLDNIALINLVSGRTVVPELIQSRATPAEITRLLRKFADDHDRYDGTLDRLHATADLLGNRDASTRGAEEILKYLRNR
jgi:lipid-A-disaccharide synthase